MKPMRMIYLQGVGQNLLDPEADEVLYKLGRDEDAPLKRLKLVPCCDCEVAVKRYNRKKGVKRSATSQMYRKVPTKSKDGAICDHCGYYVIMTNSEVYK